MIIITIITIIITNGDLGLPQAEPAVHLLHRADLRLRVMMIKIGCDIVRSMRCNMYMFSKAVGFM